MQESAGRETAARSARRAQIIAATIDTVAELGYPRTTFARIAERGGLSSTRLISYHFAGKHELMAATVAHVYAAIDAFVGERTADRPDARSLLAAYISSVVEFIDGHRPQMQALLSIFVSFRDESGTSHSYDADTERGVLGRIEEILRRGQADGEFRDFDAFVMAATIQRSIDGLPLLLETEPDLDLDTYARELVTLFDLATRAD